MRSTFENLSVWLLNFGSQFQIKRRFYGAAFLGFIIDKKPMKPLFYSAMPDIQFGATIGLVL